MRKSSSVNSLSIIGFPVRISTATRLSDNRLYLRHLTRYTAWLHPKCSPFTGKGSSWTRKRTFNHIWIN